MVLLEEKEQLPFEAHFQNDAVFLKFRKKCINSTIEITK